jgi:hypothetical protein
LELRTRVYYQSIYISQKIKEKLGDDIILYTPEEAKAEGLTMNDFSNPIMKIAEPLIPELPILIQVAKSGKESRRERRKKARKSNKKNI